MKSQLFGKDPDAGKDQEEKRATEDEMAGWHHRLNGHESEQTPQDSEGLESLVCCRPRDHKELDLSEQLNNNKSLRYKNFIFDKFIVSLIRTLSLRTSKFILSSYC